MGKYIPRILLVLLSGLVCLQTSCHGFRQIKRSVPLAEQPFETLNSKLSENEFKTAWLSAKATVSTKIGKEDVDFTASIRFRQDSIIWISISPGLGVEAFRVLITRDSVKVINRIEKKYLCYNYRYFEDLMNISASFKMIQAVLSGNYFSYRDATKLHSAYVEEPFYLLSTLEKRKQRRADEDTVPSAGKRIIQDLWLSPETYRIRKFSTQDKKAKQSMFIGYDDFKPIGARLFPYHCAIDLKGDKDMKIDITYTKVVADIPQEFPFNIPEKYEKIH